MSSSSNSSPRRFARLRQRAGLLRSDPDSSSSPSPSPEPPDPSLEDSRPSRQRVRSTSELQSFTSFLNSSNATLEDALLFDMYSMSPETTPSYRTSFKRKALSSIRGESSSPDSRPHNSARRGPSVSFASSSARTVHRSHNWRPGYLTFADLDFASTEDDTAATEHRLDLDMVSPPQNPVSLNGVNLTNNEVCDLLEKDTSRFQRVAGACAVVLVKAPAFQLHHVKYLALQGSGRRGYDLVAPQSQLVGLNCPANPPHLATWPGTELPVEIFDNVTQNLSRDDVKQMRLVCKDFEYKVSHNLFHTAVVPFNTELYDMIDETAKNASRALAALSVGPGKSKGKMRAPEDSHVAPNSPALNWQNAKNDKDGKMYRGHGLRVFQGFGPRIQRFGMSFEVQEDQLFNPPAKQALEKHESYHGKYNWPPLEYARFANIAGLERTADELSRMKAAFANLSNTKELALSIDNGLGWLTGSDKSIRARVFQRPSTIFGSEYNVPDEKQRMAEKFWSALQQSHASLRANGEQDLKRTHLAFRLVKKGVDEIPGLSRTVFDNEEYWPTVHKDSTPLVERRTNESHATDANESPAERELKPQDSRLGVVFAVSDWGSIGLSRSTRNLSREQKEWLLEMEWAQRAFLESYMLAVVDNRQTFGANITRLHIPKLSSFFIPTIARSQFWYALPALQDVTIHVSPAWRTVDKDTAGCATLVAQTPSAAVDTFYSVILRDRLATNTHIKKLSIGWADGGEHAQGLFARNSHILPAPIIDLHQSLTGNPLSILLMPYVEHLTFYNCWITPIMLERFVLLHTTFALKKLTLDSVSLTADPNALPAGGQAQGANAPVAPLNPAQLHMAALGNIMNGPQAHGINWHAFFNVPAPNAANGSAQPHNGQGAGLVFGGGFALPNAAQGGVANNPPPLPPAQAVATLAQAPVAGPAAPGAAAAAAAAAAPVPAPLGAAATSAPAPTGPVNGWSHGHRHGSWATVLDLVSPGPTFATYRPAPQPWEDQISERITNLKELELKSCGYAKFLTAVAFDQHMFDNGTDPRNIGQWWEKKRDHLSASLMEERDRFMAIIVPEINNRERLALQYAWNLVEGWSDAEKAQEATYDGHPVGGSGRITGTITHDMAPTNGVSDT